MLCVIGVNVSNTELLTLQDAVSAGYAAYSTLRKHIADGHLPAYKNASGRVMLRREDLDAWAEPRLVAPAVEQVDDEIQAWAESIAADAPPLTPEQAHTVVSMLVKGGAAA